MNIIIIFICLLIIFFEIKLSYMCKKKKLLAIPVIVWMLHSIFFYLYQLFVAGDCSFVFYWHNALEIHGYITILSLSIYRYLKHSRKRG